ncbi:unnamed protein product [marine sediment metagenome]|uniref:Uncharacterized protein n=1 Tax=marine sediment metagenome TaxID=412755 RepID=X1N8C0_9ZZZZ
MDTSEAYIQMCDCEEIQQTWAPIVGDYCNPREGFLGHLDSNFVDILYEGHDVYIDAVRCKQQSVFLPRQDQLQEMVGLDLDKLLTRFHYWEDGSGFIKERDELFSMEQLWLAFVMFQLYSKKWDGTKWTG